MMITQCLTASSSLAPFPWGLLSQVALIIAMVDYSMGNQQCFFNALEALGVSVVMTASESQRTHADLLSLPGVGAFPAGIQELRKTGLDRTLGSHVNCNHSLIGICIGMQLLFEHGEESEKSK